LVRRSAVQAFPGRPAPSRCGVRRTAERAGRELVRVRQARLDRRLGDRRDAVHRVRDPLAVPVERGALRRRV